MRGGPTQFESGLGRYRLHVGDTAHAVGAENLCRLFHRLTQTLGGLFVNGKMQPERGSWCDPNDKPTGFQGVARALNEFFATRLLMCVGSWPALFSCRSFHLFYDATFVGCSRFYTSLQCCIHYF